MNPGELHRQLRGALLLLAGLAWLALRAAETLRTLLWLFLAPLIALVLFLALLVLFLGLFLWATYKATAGLLYVCRLMEARSMMLLNRWS
jgi:hypothetical protein